MGEQLQVGDVVEWVRISGEASREGTITEMRGEYCRVVLTSNPKVAMWPAIAKCRLVSRPGDTIKDEIVE